MELPNRHLAYVPEAKITRYLLDVNHPDAWGKAREFRNRGYNEGNIDTMARDLISVAQSELVSSVRPNDYGLNYVIYGVIQPPIGGPLLVRTVWFIPHSGGAPSLATAHPRNPRRRIDRRNR